MTQTIDFLTKAMLKSRELLDAVQNTPVTDEHRDINDFCWRVEELAGEASRLLRNYE